MCNYVETTTQQHFIVIIILANGIRHIARVWRSILKES